MQWKEKKKTSHLLRALKHVTFAEFENGFSPNPTMSRIAMARALDNSGIVSHLRKFSKLTLTIKIFRKFDGIFIILLLRACDSGFDAIMIKLSLE